PLVQARKALVQALRPLVQARKALVQALRPLVQAWRPLVQARKALVQANQGKFGCLPTHWRYLPLLLL
ncbi:hypothetical protein KJ975_02770, partial [Myxococcota bacterium]|nr:hypothetical protein [Myxococcota bacterium]